MKHQFEFLRNTLAGQFIPRRSWFHFRDPRARLMSLVFLFIGMVFTSNVWGLITSLMTILLIYLLSKLPFKPAWKTILRALPFILILSILQIVLTVQTDNDVVLFTVFGLDILDAGMLDGSLLILRFTALICLLNVGVMSISTSQVSSALFNLFKPFEKLGFPVNDLTMVTQITLRYIPIVSQIAEKTAKAQAARGGDWERRGFNPIKQAKMVLPLIVPIMVMSLKRAETMAVAMESRGFNAADKRSSYYELSFDWQDVCLTAISFLLACLMILSGFIF